MIGNQDFVVAEYYARTGLEDAGLRTLALADMEMPQLQTHVMPDGARVRYAAFGNVADAETVLATSLPWSTFLDDDSTMVRLKAQSMVLFDTVCVVGIEAYRPDPCGYFTRHEKRKLKSGDFRPVAERFMGVVEALDLQDDQELDVMGFSFAADTAVETAYQNLTDAQFGVRPIDRLTVVECARTRKLAHIPIIGALKAGLQFGASGKDLYDNVVASNSRALLEARGIDEDDSRAQKRHDRAVAKGVLEYIQGDLSGNLALAEGFAQDTSATQLHIVAESPDAPKLIVGRASRSKVCPPEFLDGFDQRVKTFTVEGDHSVADKLSNSGGLARMAVGR